MNGITMSDSPAPPPTIPRSWKIAFGVAVVMVVLAMVGVGLTTTNRDIAPKYWLSLVPVYGLLCVAVAWMQKRRGATGRLVVRQVLHWLAIAAAIWLDFYVRRAGEETGETAGFTALLLLALGCLLAGVHLEWMFAIVGVLLATTLMLAEKAEQYLWLVFIGGAVAVVVMVWLMRMMARAKRNDAAAAIVAART
jgi:hypothetical protein